MWKFTRDRIHHTISLLQLPLSDAPLSIITYIIKLWLRNLKPQDSFGEFNNFFLCLQKVQKIIRKHHQTFLQLFWMTCCPTMLPNCPTMQYCPMANYHYVHNLWQSVRGDSEHFYVWVINSSYNPIKFCTNKKFINFHFRHVPKLYALALSAISVHHSELCIFIFSWYIQLYSINLNALLNKIFHIYTL